MDTFIQQDFITELANPSSVAVDNENMILYFNEKNEGGSVYAIPFLFNPQVGVTMIAAANYKDLGLTINLNSIEKGGKTIMFPDSLTIDASGNL